MRRQACFFADSLGRQSAELVIDPDLWGKTRRPGHRDPDYAVRVQTSKGLYLGVADSATHYGMEADRLGGDPVRGAIQYMIGGPEGQSWSSRDDGHGLQHQHHTCRRTMPLPEYVAQETL